MPTLALCLEGNRWLPGAVTSPTCCPCHHSPGEKQPEVKKRSCFIGGRGERKESVGKEREIKDERKARRKERDREK